MGEEGQDLGPAMVEQATCLMAAALDKHAS
jgi:hypothetical protein